MYLLIITTLLSVASVSNTYITKPILNWLNRPSKDEQTLREEISNIRKQQSHISISENFAAHAKLQRKINALELKLQGLSNGRTTHNYILHLVVVYGTKIAFALFLFGIAIYYRRTPVYIFPEYIDLSPFSGVISYPNEQLGAVSVHFWLLVTNSVARQILK